MAYIYDLADTWNASGTTFTGIKLNVTDTASAASSLLMDLQVNGVRRFRITKNQTVILGSGAYADTTTLAFNNYHGDVLGGTPSTHITGSYGEIDLTIGGQGSYRFGGSSIVIKGIAPISWSSALYGIGTADLFLYREAANTLAQRNGTAAQAFNLYGTYTDGSNYRRLSSTISTGGVAEIKSEGLGSGISGNTLKFIVGSTTAISISTAGDTTLNGLNMNNGGISSAFSVKVLDNGFHGFATSDVAFARSAAGIGLISNGSTGGASLEFREQTAPAAPATNNVRIYAEDNGSGKTRIMALFATGAAVQIAIEP